MGFELVSRENISRNEGFSFYGSFIWRMNSPIRGIDRVQKAVYLFDCLYMLFSKEKLNVRKND